MKFRKLSNNLPAGFFGLFNRWNNAGNPNLFRAHTSAFSVNAPTVIMQSNSSHFLFKVFFFSNFLETGNPLPYANVANLLSFVNYIYKSLSLILGCGFLCFFQVKQHSNTVIIIYFFFYIFGFLTLLIFPAGG